MEREAGLSWGRSGLGKKVGDDEVGCEDTFAEGEGALDEGRGYCSLAVGVQGMKGRGLVQRIVEWWQRGLVGWEVAEEDLRVGGDCATGFSKVRVAKRQ